MVLGITKRLNSFTPGMTFGHFAKKVLYKGVGCGYIEAAGKRRYVLTPVIDKLVYKMELNDFYPNYPRVIDFDALKTLKTLLKPLIRNEKGFKKFLLPNKNFQYSPSPAAVTVWEKGSGDAVITIVKEIKHPTREIIFHRFPFLRRIWRLDPFKELEVN